MRIPDEWINALKREDSKKYYYLVGVRKRVSKDMKVKCNCDFVLEYTTADIEKANLAKAMINNEMAKTDSKEALQAVGLTSISSSIFGISTRIRFNPEISVHKFVTDCPFEDEWFDMFVKMAPICESTRKTLKESEIRI